ncbi:MAG: hypothetical protein AAGB07_09795 [Pseudomonadota bacterium]
MNIELYWDYLFNNPQSQVISEMTASQLPGRQNGGAADAYRHLLLSAELTRDYGSASAFDVLTDHERESASGADNGLDMWNNSIGMQIGQYVRDNGGTWEDVVRLSRAAMVGSFDSGNFDQVSNWNIRTANDGIRKAYDEYVRQHNASWNPLNGDPILFEEFASDFNQSYSFRVNDNVIILEDGNLILNSAAMTSPGNWAVHPKVLIDGEWVELSVAQSQFPSATWFEGVGFVYEDGTAAPVLNFTADQLNLLTECFGGDVPIDMWPLDPDLKPGPDGIYDQDEVRAKVWKKPIEQIEVGDIVVSFDDNDNLVPGPVARTFQNNAKILLDFHGTRVTPGHVYYRPDSKKSYKYETLIDILRDDGVIKHQDGTLIRAATNVPVDSPRDGFVQAVTQTRKADGAVVQQDKGGIRLGTRFLVGEGEDRRSFAIADLIEYGGGVVGDDELIRVGDGEPMPFLWDFGDTLPKPEDFVLACSGTTLEEIYKAAEWESQGPRLPAPMVLDRGAVQPLKGAALYAMPRNEPLDVAHVPMASAKPQRTLNRKQRKAMEAKQRETAKNRKGVAG